MHGQWNRCLGTEKEYVSIYYFRMVASDMADGQKAHFIFYFASFIFFGQIYPCTIVLVSFTICCFRLAMASYDAVDQVQCPIG